MFILSFLAISWKFVTPLRIPRCHGALVAFGDRLFLCGGLSSADRNGDVNAVTSLSAIDVYREDTDTWYHLTDLAVPRHQVASAVLGKAHTKTKKERMKERKNSYSRKWVEWVVVKKDRKKERKGKNIERWVAR